MAYVLAGIDQYAYMGFDKPSSIPISQTGSTPWPIGPAPYYRGSYIKLIEGMDKRSLVMPTMIKQTNGKTLLITASGPIELPGNNYPYRSAYMVAATSAGVGP
jgi:hypothetical protein